MGIWDQIFKQLIFKFPGDFTRWLADAEFLEELNPKLGIPEMEADALMRAWRNDMEEIIHIECQKRVERTKMPRRMWKYNTITNIKHDLPVISFLIYLKQEERIAEPFYEIKSSDGEVIHRFHYYPIELYNISTEELRAFGGIPGLAFLPLTRDGGHPEVVEEAIQEVQAQVTPGEQGNVLSILFWFASLALGKKDQDWLTRRFYMLDEILSETPLAKHLEERGAERERERTREEIKHAQEEAQRAREEAQRTREEALEQTRQTLSAIVSAHFPNLLALAQKQGELIMDTTTLNLLIVQVSIAQTEEDARQYLLGIA